MAKKQKLNDAEAVFTHWNEIRRILTDRFIPEAAQAHFRASEKEALQGIRSLLDHAIDKVAEREEESKIGRQRKSASIQIEEE